MKWTMDDYRTVSIVTIFNSLWLGFVAWLILGLWFEKFSFISIWIVAMIISWIVAIYRQSKVIVARDSAED